MKSITTLIAALAFTATAFAADAPKAPTVVPATLPAGTPGVVVTTPPTAAASAAAASVIKPAHVKKHKEAKPAKSSPAEVKTATPTVK